MKSVKYLVAALLFVLIWACYNDDNTNVEMPQTTNENFEGEWKLVNVSGGIMGVNDTFPEGMITWKVNGISQTIAVTNDNPDAQAQDILPDGIYNYSFVPNEATPELCDMTIKVGDVNLGCYNITSEEFTMSQVESDGFFIKLVR